MRLFGGESIVTATTLAAGFVLARKLHWKFTKTDYVRLAALIFATINAVSRAGDGRQTIYASVGVVTQLMMLRVVLAAVCALYRGLQEFGSCFKKNLDLDVAKDSLVLLHAMVSGAYTSSLK